MNNIFHMYIIQRDLDKIRNYQKINYKLFTILILNI